MTLVVGWGSLKQMNIGKTKGNIHTWFVCAYISAYLKDFYEGRYFAGARKKGWVPVTEIKLSRKLLKEGT